MANGFRFGCLTVALALSVCAALLLVAAMFTFTGSGRRVRQDVQVHGPATPPQLVFACEMDEGPLQALFSDPTVIPQLKELNAGVALALKDFSLGRTQVVQQLNRAGVPVTAWLALPKEQGYYLNASNAGDAVARFAKFKKWTAENGLQWVAVGLDIEPNLSEFGALKHNKLRIVALMMQRMLDGGRLARAKQGYSDLIREIQADGYPVQTYQFVIIADEREAHSTLLERILGLVDVRGNDEVLMAYTSFNHNLDSALIWAYGADAQTLAVGATGPSGDAQLDARFPPLDWDEFSRDLIVASHFSRVIGVFSLEGCVHQGFLPRLKTFNWSQSVTVPADSITKVRRFRRVLKMFLWTGSHLLYIVALVLLICGWRYWRSRS